MKTRKPEDKAAAQVEFGVELETMIPVHCGITVGIYHCGAPVTRAVRPVDPRAARMRMEQVVAPDFNSNYWRAERDGSIAADPDYMPCEFVSPVLKGEAGLIALRDFVRFATNIGAKVNASCGCHVTIGLKSILGNVEPDVVRNYLRRLVRVANRHTWAIYAQTGTSRHQNAYARQLPKEGGEITNELMYRQKDAAADVHNLRTLANLLGRGMVNCMKAFPTDMRKSAVEFRAFAGTLNEKKVMHHVATCLALARRARSARVIPHFTSQRKPEDAPAALRELWQSMGWVDDLPGLDCALGQFGILHSEFPAYSELALKMAQKFEAKHPRANL